MSLVVEVEIESTDTAVKRCTQALIDCGATGCFIDIKWAMLNNIPTCPLTKPIPVYNVDGTANDAGMITDIADVILCYENHSERTQLAVTCLGKQSLILGYNWLQNHNLEINWQTKDVKMSHCPLQCSTCRVEDKRDAKRQKSTTSQINACRSGAFPTMTEEDEDESPQVNTGKQSLILGYNWLHNHNPEINWQTQDVKMSCCPLQCSTCRVEDKHEAKIWKSMTSQINAFRAGAFPMMVDKDKDESPQVNMVETDEEVQDTCPAFDDDLDSEVDNFTIEEDDCVFMMMVHPVNPHHFVRASSTVSGRLVEAFAKNSKPKGVEDIVPTSLHTYANIFSETAFDSLPEHRKWDYAIELEHKPSPGFHKVYPMTLTEQMEMDVFLEEALATGHIR
jgi:predicted aspartyl protease